MLVRHRSLDAVILLVIASLILLGCSASTEIKALDSDTVEDTLSSEEPLPELSSEDVYQAVRDSIVFVLAPDGESSGSGIVIDGGWILTNAHVVDRHDSVRIGRSDGEDLGLHQVHALDWTFDLALVGPITDTSLVPIQRGVSGELDLGARVLLVGFPDEDTVAPTPTLTQGIVSRRRFVSLGAYPFLQVDATIAPGQSGGALVNGRGELVGISGLQFGLGEFGLVFAADAMWPRIDNLMAGDRTQLPNGQGVRELVDEVGPLQKFGFTVEVDESGHLVMQVTGDADVWVDVQNLGGFTVNQSETAVDPFQGIGTDSQLFIDARSDGNEDVDAIVEPGTYQVLIGSFSDTVTTVTVTSDSMLRRFDDVDEQRLLPLGELVEGSFDWSQDTDKWNLPLEAGQEVSIRADGIADTVLVVRLGDVVITSSDDEGLGLFGTGSQVDFVAEESGTYVVQIGSYDSDRWGYLIQATLK